MSDLILIEIKKFKRKKLFYFAILLALVFPLIGAILIAGGNDADFGSITGFIREESGFLLQMPILVILAVNLFFIEIDNGTLKNLLVIPVKKKNLILTKLLVILGFSILFQLVGFLVSIVISTFYGITVTNIGINFLITLCIGLFLWAAALPCITIVIFFNRSYLLSIIIVFAYSLINYVMHFSENILMKPVGFNLGTIFPVPLIFRWLYQFYTPVGDLQTKFYIKFSEYFISTPVCFLR